ncbi:MAG: hypothetical protein RLZ98_3168 [Pseudomonadota bacterium]|jgi:hypothetical protein
MGQSFGEMLAWVPKSRHLGESLSRAHDYARGQGHAEVDLEHMLLALLDDPDAGAVLQVCSVSAESVRSDVESRLGGIGEAEFGEVRASQGLSRILEYAVAAARQSKRREVNGAIVLAAIVGEGRSSAAEVLRAHGLTFEEAIKALQSPAVKSRIHETEAGQHSTGSSGGQVKPVPAAPVAGAGSTTTEDILETARRRVGERTHEAVRSGQVDEAVDEIDPQPSSAMAESRQGPEDPERVTQTDATVSAESPQDKELPAAAPARAERTPPNGWAPPVPQPKSEPQPVRAPRGRTQPPPLPLPASAPVPELGQSSRQPAGAPWQAQHYESADGGAQTGRAVNGSAVDGSLPKAVARQQTTARREQVPASFEAGKLVHTIPRLMKVGRSELVEIRIARSAVMGIEAGLRGAGAPELHYIVVTKAMSVRLRAPEGGFFIETASPETQWIDNQLGVYGGDDFATWRFVVTPQTAGQRQLQMIVSARTVGADGLTAETALPDQVITVKVRANYAKAARRWIGWALAAVVGGVLARFGEGLWAIAGPVLRSFVGPG